MKRSKALFVGCGVAALVALAAPIFGASGPCRSVSTTARRECYGEIFSERLKTEGIAAAVAELDALGSRDSWVAEHSHEFAHGIGIEGFQRYPDIVPAFLACGDGSASGCRHGFMQAYLESQHHIAGPELQSLCRPLENPEYSRSLLFQCIHGVGHGLTMFRGHDLPSALRDCDLLATAWDQTSCYGGVFMEVFVNATSPHHPATQLAGNSHEHHAASRFRAIDPQDPLYPCSIVAQRYLYACYQIQTSVILHLNRGSIAGTAKVCDRAPPDMRASCYESLGRDVTAYASRDPGKTAQLCARGTVPYRSSCYAGAAKSLVNWTATTEGALEMCRILRTDRNASMHEGLSCYRALGEAIATMVVGLPEREEQCLRSQSPTAIAACREGAGLR
jgi:hypothetical protein